MALALKKTLLGRFVIVAGMSALMLTSSISLVAPAYANGPASVADLAAGLLDAVVNISTSQTINGPDDGGPESEQPSPLPKMPDGSPFQQFFDDFFKDQGGNGNGLDGGNNGSRKVQSLGSGFVKDALPEGFPPVT